MGPRNFVLTIIIATVAILFIVLTWVQNSPPMGGVPVPPTTVPEQATPIAESALATSSVQLAMLDTAQISNGATRGCDRIVMVNRSIPSTTTPLTAALNILFALSTTSVDGWFNFISRTGATLHFDHVSIVSGTATIYLTGSLSGLAGICDDLRAEIQIEETAKQFPNVSNVQLFLNNAAVTTLAPNMK